MKLTELQELLDAAANAIPDPERSRLSDVVRTARRRRLGRRGLTTIVASLAIVATGIALEVRDRPSPTLGVGPLASTSTTAPSPSSTTRPECTEADLRQPIGNGRPAPKGVTSQFFLRKNEAWLDPAGTAMPTVTAEEAWRKLTKNMAGGGRAQLLLGYYTSIFPIRNGAPEEVHVLAWVVFVEHIALPTPGGPFVLGTASTVPRPICGFGTAYTVLDATTGQQLVFASY